jgi:hypothetical protein
VQQAEGDVLGEDVVVPELPSLVLRGLDRPPRAFGEPGERVVVEGVGQQALPVGS